MIEARWSHLMGAAVTRTVGVFARVAAGILLLWASTALAAANSVEPSTGDATKAAFVLRFAGYVEWPADQHRQADFRIAVLGDPSLATDLEQLGNGRMVAGRPVRISRVTSASQARDAQVLVVGESRRGELGSLLRPLAGHPVLVVTSEPDALPAGSVINFLGQQDGLRFEISLPAARRTGLRIGSELLSVAARVLQ